MIGSMAWRRLSSFLSCSPIRLALPRYTMCTSEHLLVDFLEKAERALRDFKLQLTLTAEK